MEKRKHFLILMATSLCLLFSETDAEAQIAPAVSGLEADAGRGILTQQAGFIEMQQTCPQRVGDAWDSTNERAWNMLEIGFQVQPETFPNPKFELYTRYNCETPFDRPKRR